MTAQLSWLRSQLIRAHKAKLNYININYITYYCTHIKHCGATLHHFQHTPLRTMRAEHKHLSLLSQHYIFVVAQHVGVSLINEPVTCAVPRILAVQLKNTRRSCCYYTWANHRQFPGTHSHAQLQSNIVIYLVSFFCINIFYRPCRFEKIQEDVAICFIGLTA